MTIPTPEQVSQEYRGLEKNEEEAAEQQQVQKGIYGLDKVTVLRDR